MQRGLCFNQSSFACHQILAANLIDKHRVHSTPKKAFLYLLCKPCTLAFFGCALNASIACLDNNVGHARFKH